MKICYVTWSYPRYTGDYAGIFVHDLAKQMQGKGHEVRVIAPAMQNTLRDEILDGIPVHRFKYYWWKKTGIVALVQRWSCILFYGIRETIKYIKQNDTDLIHAYWVVPTGLLGVIAGRILKKPVIITAAGSDLNKWPGVPLVRILVKYALKHTDKLIAIGSGLKEKALGLGMNENHTHVIFGNAGINLEVFSPKNTRKKIRAENDFSNNRIVLYVGSLFYPKRVDCLIRDFKTVKEKVPEAKLIIVGDGSEREKLEAITENLGLEKDVLFKGKKSNAELPYFLEMADVFVYASEREGIPTAITEALSMGLPIVSSRVGGIADVLKDDYNGFLVDGYDGAFTEHIITILQDDALRAKLGKNAMEFAVNNLSSEKILPELEKIYEETRG